MITAENVAHAVAAHMREFFPFASVPLLADTARAAIQLTVAEVRAAWVFPGRYAEIAHRHGSHHPEDDLVCCVGLLVVVLDVSVQHRAFASALALPNAVWPFFVSVRESARSRPGRQYLALEGIFRVSTILHFCTGLDT